MEEEKQLLENLDLCEPSKTLFITNYKLLKRELTKCKKSLKEIKEHITNAKDIDEKDYFERNSYFLHLSIVRIKKALDVAKSILEEGVTNDKMIVFYLSFYHLYEVIDYV